jgi:formylglycine-generating enzyme required for sulfatase activity
MMHPARGHHPLELVILCLIAAGLLCQCAATGEPVQQAGNQQVQPDAAGATKLRSGDGAEMVYVPAGEFPMGSTESDVALAMESNAGWSDDWFAGEVPQHAVALDAYWIDRHLVTNEQFARFIKAGGYEQRNLWTQQGWDWKTAQQRVQPQYWESPPWNEPNRPVIVGWFEAVAYCRWAGARLPTDAEWERAAGWDAEKQEKRVYPWGNEWEPGRANTRESGRQQTTPAGEYCPQGQSPVGACDMAGNVWEWCSSLHMPYPYDPADGREDLEATGTRVLRGGSWLNASVEARTTYRLPPFPGDFILFDPTDGFRCALSDG